MARRSGRRSQQAAQADPVAGRGAEPGVAPARPRSGKRPGRIHSADRQPGQTAFAGDPGRETIQPIRRGLAGYFAGTSADKTAPDRSGNPLYVKVSSKGQIGYLPRANLLRAREIDANLKVLNED